MHRWHLHLCTHVEILGPIPQVCVRHREWRSICDHAGSPNRLITVKPHLFFDDALSLVVLTATMLLPKKMISLKAIESYIKPPLRVFTR
ncbi:hypothetical protein HKD37_02G004359 [Glycine soja]|nr:hypothetical protein GmHk_02G004479 [Glycine max]